MPSSLSHAMVAVAAGSMVAPRPLPRAFGASREPGVGLICAKARSPALTAMATKSPDRSPVSSHPRKRDDIVVFQIVRDSACAECGTELLKGEFLRMENERPHCLACADLDRLVFLPSGDPALTRRAGRHSKLRAVVVRFSRSRGRYERQGVLVDEEALARAEVECLSDADARRLARARAAERRSALDAAYVEAFASRLGELFPRCPPDERRAIAEHACQKYSGRVGRSAAAKALDEHAVGLAVRAHVRHAHTEYDELLGRGVERHEARSRIAGLLERRLAEWRRA
jgi:hypothetical protein